MAVPDILLLCRCAEFTLSCTRETENRISNALQTSAATSLIMGLRVCRFQRAVVAIGMFSLFESLLQDRMCWDAPFRELPYHLKTLSKTELAQVFEDYKDAINVLKHGKGPSYERLLERTTQLEFRVKLLGTHFFEEGDVSEVQTLIDVNEHFVMRCAEIIEEIALLLRLQE